MSSSNGERGLDRPWAVIAGGGTAGHVLPGLAVAGALVKRGRAADTIRFVGSTRGIEARLVPAAGFPLTMLPGRGIERRLTVANVRAVLGIIVGVGRAIRLVRRWRPKVVMVLGGYAAVPCLVAAVVWRVPVVVAEQNARAGLANRLAGRVARACAVPFDRTDLPRAVVTGNPVRSEVVELAAGTARADARRSLGIPEGRTVLAAFAGSLGATRINDAVAELADRWSDRGDVAIYHVIGARDWERRSPAEAETSDEGLWYRPVRYEEHMDHLLAASEVAVCRSGGTTVAELAVAGLPAVLVPLPIAPRDHQTANAAPLVAAGAAVLVPDAELDPDRLEALLGSLLADRGRLEEMARAAHTLARPDAADAVAALLEEHARA
jgi:undecaprenyldiphospho-muramoylpentapeptide beta-N-acetylglucosaminyltransferase